MNYFESSVEKEPLVTYVYRLEDENGDGPFKKGDIGPQDFPNKGVGYKRNDDDRRRFMEWLTSESIDPDTLLSGTKNPSLLGEYFPVHSLKELFDKGYRLSKYRVPHKSLFSGKHETLFKKEDSQLVARFSSFEEIEK